MEEQTLAQKLRAKAIAKQQETTQTFIDNTVKSIKWRIEDQSERGYTAFEYHSDPIPDIINESEVRQEIDMKLAEYGFIKLTVDIKFIKLTADIKNNRSVHNSRVIGKELVIYCEW